MLLATTTTSPTSSWLAQQLRQLTPFGQGPKFLLRDHDAKFGAVFDDVAKGPGVRVVRTPVMAPKSNAHCERLIGSVRRECLDHVLILGEDLQRVLDEYRDYYNARRPHQGIGQRRPDTFDRPARSPQVVAPRHVMSRPILGTITTGSPRDLPPSSPCVEDERIGQHSSKARACLHRLHAAGRPLSSSFLPT
jgi:putative transposase